MSKLKIIFLIPVLLLVMPVCAQHLTGTQISTLGRSVVKIKVILPGGRQKIATGFIYPSSEYAITAYHVVAGVTNVIVRYENSLVEKQGVVERVNKDSDLALIRIISPLNVPVLTLSTASATVNQSVTALGYYLDVISMDQRKLSVSSSNPLRNILPQKNVTEIQNSGCPSLNLSVYKLQDNPLVPGYSGCPVFNSNGEVVGVGDGGLENGAYSISWAIPSTQINALLTSSQSITGNTIQSTAYFSADIITPSDIDGLTVGGLAFRKVRTRSLQDLTSSATDDLFGLNQILSTFPPSIDRTNLFFDIYQEPSSGGIIVIPVNMTTRVDGNTITITDAMNRYETRITAENNITQFQMQQNTANFEFTFAGTSLSWVPDPAFTYPMPVTRPDGLMVRRKAFIGWGGVNNPQSYMIETFAYKNGTLLCAANKKKDYNTSFFQARNNCMMSNFSGPGCNVVLEDMNIWGSMIVATHLTSFSI